MQTFLIGGISLLVGGGMAGAAIFGLVDSQTKVPSKSPASVTNPVLNYGESQ
ncbi:MULTISPECIES: hypothetical protein [unclassified Nocardioides]|uniref:hypothetical protein n=1 Tax=unclassified Nocardioides TaxID=2615069 RepID=UPI000A51AB32|nr:MULTISPECIES: hypothetical protein [unclassified Nocardioides]